MGHVHGERSRGPIQLRAASVQIPLSAWVAVWCGQKLGAGLRSLFGHPLVIGLLVVVSAGAWLLPRYGTTIPAAVLATQDTVAPLDAGDRLDLTGLPIGRREDGPLYYLRLLGTHLLLVGATGAGKSSVVWALVHALAPGIASGLVSLWVLDPKGGMELAPGRRLFARFCHGAAPEAGDSTSHEVAYAELLEDAVAVMRDRQARLRGITRLHDPSTTEPLVVVVIDELASLTSYVTDRDAKKRIAAALSLLLSQGRAVGVTVVAALQDPRKEVLPARDLFPTRVGLRMVDADQVDMVLGDGAKHRGARCDQIPESLPGVGYVALDGVAEPVRVRFAHLTDHDIAYLTETHPAPDSQVQRPRLGVV